MPPPALSGSNSARRFRQLLMPNAPSTFSKFYVFRGYQHSKCSHFRRLLFSVRRLLSKVRTTLHLNSTELRCAQSTCIVYHQPALYSIKRDRPLHKDDRKHRSNNQTKRQEFGLYSMHHGAIDLVPTEPPAADRGTSSNGQSDRHYQMYYLPFTRSLEQRWG